MNSLVILPTAGPDQIKSLAMCLKQWSPSLSARVSFAGNLIAQLCLKLKVIEKVTETLKLNVQVINAKKIFETQQICH